MLKNSLIVILLLIVIYVCIQDNYTKKCNDIDGRCYQVIDDHQDQEKASEILGQLNQFSIRLLRHLREKYVYRQEGTVEQRSAVRYLLRNYNPDNIVENRPLSSDNTSFVEDKGKLFAMCLREKKSGMHNFHSLPELEFVLLHELSHLATFVYSHGLEFWQTFKFILTEAKLAGLHEPINYAIYPFDYCSLLINYNPYFDDRITMI